MVSDCWCCGACKPRYKSKVDVIFPANAVDGLVKGEMDKLTYYAMRDPEKLDRIGAYLDVRLQKDIYRQRKGFVFITMEALDHLLSACRSDPHMLNLFVESFLKMVQRLLETGDPELQTLAAESFRNFANIEEDTPSYHRHYDFFVSKFSSLCHDDHPDLDTRLRLRCAGLSGIRGVVRKTVGDELTVNIWQNAHMGKIIPSLLFNMHDVSSTIRAAGRRSITVDDGVDGGCVGGEDLESSASLLPSKDAEAALRDLVCRAAFNNIKALIKPVLDHLDSHELWTASSEFEVKIFDIIMYSVQMQYSHVVIAELIAHLDRHGRSDPCIKAKIINVVAKVVLIAAGGSIGPSVLEIFNTLLKHLRISVDVSSSKSRPPQYMLQMSNEHKLQESIITTIGEFANNLPDFQKIQVLEFIIAKVPRPVEDEFSGNVNGGASDVLLQTMLLKTLLKVATKYKTVHYSQTFTSSFLDPLLRISLAPHPGIRLIVQEIFHTLIDRHDNLEKLKRKRFSCDISRLGLVVEKCPRQDIMFMKKTGQQLYWNLSESISRENNSSTNLEAIFTTLALLAVELGADEFQVDLIRVCLGLQKITHDPESTLPTLLRYQIQAMIASLLSLVAQLSGKEQLATHVQTVIENRKKDAPSLLPQFIFPRHKTKDESDSSPPPPPPLSVRKSSASGVPVDGDPLGITITFTDIDGDDQIDSRINNQSTESDDGSPPLAKLPTEYCVEDEENLLFSETRISEALGSDVTPLQPLQPTMPKSPRSLSDIQSLVSDSSVYSTEKRMSGLAKEARKEDLSFEALKKILVGAQSEEMKEAKEKKRLEVLEMYEKAPFEELVAAAEARAKAKHHLLSDILGKIALVDSAAANQETLYTSDSSPPPIPPPPAMSDVEGEGGVDRLSSDRLDGQLRLFLPIIMERTAEPPAKLFQFPDYKPPPFFEMKFPDLIIY